MKTNKKLKLNTKKVVILSNEQQNSVQGGNISRDPLCVQYTDMELCGPGTTFGGDCGGGTGADCGGTGTGGGTNTVGCPPITVVRCIL